nr:hypothetical protein [Acetivibrio clariflavus]
MIAMVKDTPKIYYNFNGEKKIIERDYTELSGNVEEDQNTLLQLW